MPFRRPPPALLTVVVANVLGAALLVAFTFSPSGQATQPARAAESTTADEELDRYAAAVARSRESFPSGRVRVVFAVTGEGRGDEVTAGPAAAVLDGPVLPLPDADIPPSIRAELARLAPERIVILGGTSAVSDATAERLADFTPGPVTRVAGADRYETAAQVATTIFTPPVPQVLIMTDAAHADPDVGGVEATATRPVLLATAGGLPPETVEALRTLRPRSIVVLGGASADVLAQLQRYTPRPVTRLPAAASGSS